jgi:hypothetical protein
MSKPERFGSLPTVEQLIAALRKGQKPRDSWREQVATWCLRVEFVCGIAILITGIAAKWFGMPHALVQDVFSILVILAVLACAGLVLLAVFEMLPVIFKSGAVYANGLDQRIAAECSVSDMLQLVPARERAWLADRIEMESRFVSRRLSIGSIVMGVASIAFGLYGKNIGVTIDMGHVLVFVVAWVIGTSIGLFTLYSVVDRLDRIAYILKNVEKHGP